MRCCLRAVLFSSNSWRVYPCTQQLYLLSVAYRPSYSTFPLYSVAFLLGAAFTAGSIVLWLSSFAFSPLPFGEHVRSGASASSSAVASPGALVPSLVHVPPRPVSPTVGSAALRGRVPCATASLGRVRGPAAADGVVRVPPPSSLQSRFGPTSPPCTLRPRGSRSFTRLRLGVRFFFAAVGSPPDPGPYSAQ